MSISAPVFTDTVDQSFFIESQGGAQQPVSYLDRFPDSVYTKAIDSVLVTFAYALLGPAGVGYLRRAYLEARLQFEDAGLNASDLDDLYSNPFAFARAALETYTTDASAALLTSQERAQILAADASFRNRAITYFKAIRAGGTLQGLSLAAQSGLNHPVEIIENYRALYDQYADIRLNLPFMGTTTGLNEVIVLPRRDVPTNAQQTILINGEPVKGWFTLTVPIGPNYQSIQVGVTNGSNTVTVPDSAQTSPGAYITILSSGVYYYAQIASVISPTSVTVVYPPQNTLAGQNYNQTISTGTYTAFVGNTQTISLPYNATYAQIQSALWALPLIGNNDLSVSGGPLPDQPIVITFTGRLADQPIPAIQVNLAPDNVTGIGGPNVASPLGSQLIDVNNNPLAITSNVVVDQVGVSADSQSAYIAPANEHAMEIALDILRPQTSFVTTVQAQGTTQRQPANAVFAGQTYTEVLRFEIGQTGVVWPAVDGTHWVQSGTETEAPRAVGDLSHHYQGFHNINNVIAYTEAALSDTGYSSGATQVDTLYWDTKIGQFNKAQTALYPMLALFTDATTQYSPKRSIASSPDPLIITKNVAGTGLINDIYPTDYLSLSGVPQLSTDTTFWASAERIPPQSGSSVDYLEIDLGTVQAVNYIYFEATNKPYLIDVAYDALDQTPARGFVPVTIMDPHVAPSITNLVYDTSVTNPWTTVELHFTNALNQMIYTRYLRLGFTRTPDGSPFTPANGSFVPYSIEVRNLRVGRNIASDMDRNLSMTMSAGTTTWAHIYPSTTLYPSTSTFPT